MIGRSLTALVIAAAVAAMSTSAKADTIRVPVQFAGINYQQIFDSVSDGDVIELYRPDNEFGTVIIRGNYSFDRPISLTINGNEFGFWAASGYALSMSNGADVTLNDTGLTGAYNIKTGEGAERLIDVKNASLTMNGGNVSGRKYGIYWDSDGELLLNKVNISGGQRTTENLVYIADNRGDVQISECLFSHVGNGIRIVKDSKESTMNILNNTVDNYTAAAVSIDGLLEGSGNIANNSFGTGLGVVGAQSRGKIVYTNNNIEPQRDVMAAMAIGEEINFSLDPQYVDSINGDYRLQSDSQLIGLGMPIEGRTDWFGDTTYIGAYGPVPEPATIGLLALGGAMIALRRKK